MSTPYTPLARCSRSTKILFAVCLLFLFVFVGNSHKAFAAEFDGPAELPRTIVQSNLANTPAPGHTIHVNVGGDLALALENASCGDTIELQSGASFAGVFTLPANPCDDDHWIVIRTSADDSLLPPEGTRITPCYAGIAALPGRPAFHCASTHNVMARIVLAQKQPSGPFLLADGANHYRFIGLEITRLLRSGPVVNLIEAMGSADHIVLDRVWVHGTAQDETRRGILLTGTTNVAIVDSFFTDFHCISVTGTCADSQSVSGGSSTLPGGPYKIDNNFLEAAGECILFGGDPSTTTPTDIEITHNHFFKPLIWQLGHVGFVGGADGNPFTVKNHFELKNAQRVLFEGNVLENNWGGFSQHGFAILLTPKGYTVSRQSMINLCPICQVTDVTIRFNTISHVGGGFLIATDLTNNGSGVPAMAGGRYSIHDVILQDINSIQYAGAGALLNISNGWSLNGLNNLSVNHITGWPDIHILTMADRVSNPKIPGFVFANNIVGAGKYPVWTAGGGVTNCANSVVPITELSRCFSAYAFDSNVIVGLPSGTKPSNWPGANYFAANSEDVGFSDYQSGDYELLTSSSYKNKGTDGKDIGADVDAIQTAIAGVD